MNKIVIRTTEQFQDFCAQDLSSIALDFETTSLSYLELEINGWSVCNGESVCYVDYADNPEQGGLLDLLKDILKNKVQFLAAHGLVYELKVMHKYGMQCPDNIYCSLVGAKLLNENLGKNGYSLKNLAHTELGIPEDEILTWEQANKFGIHSKEFREYGMKDSIWCWELTEKETPQLKAQDLWYLATTVEMPFQRVLADLEINGVLVDKETLHKFIPKCKDILFELEILMLEELGMVHDVVEQLDRLTELVSPVNFDSSKQLVMVAQDILGLEITERTKRSKKFPKGQPSVDKFTIARLKAKSEFFNLLSRYRKLNTLYKTFLAPCESYMDVDGRIRPSYNMVRTGRLSCVPEDSQILTKQGWKYHNQLVLGESVMGYNILKDNYEWTKLQGIHEEIADVGYVKSNKGKDSKYIRGLFCTVNHNWIVKHLKIKGFVKSNSNTKGNCRKLLLPKINFPDCEKSLLTPYQAGILGWYLTDGYAQNKNSTNKKVSLNIGLLKKSSIKFLDDFLVIGDYTKKVYSRIIFGQKRNVTNFYIRTKVFDFIYKLIGNYSPSELVLNLSSAARKQMFLCMLEGDGSKRRGKTRFDRFGGEKFSNKNVCDYFSLLCVALGQPYTVSEKCLPSGTRFLNYQLLTKELLANKNYKWKPIKKSSVWCPKTGLGTWVMKQNDMICITGNCSRPNLQNLPNPKKEKLEFNHRTLFVAGD